MKRHAALFVIALLSAIPVSAQDPPSFQKNPAYFCQGAYALCIKAPCTPIVTKNSDGTYSIDQANCLCDMEVGWSMGPDSDCDSRKPTKGEDGRMYVISTYSNFFNKTNLTLTCENKPWAWCYGSPCVLDAKNASKAICTCPVIDPSTFMTLGGECRQAACDSIWSAAYPKEDAFANNHFYNYLTKQGAKPAPNPPAKDCPTKPTSPPSK